MSLFISSSLAPFEGLYEVVLNGQPRRRTGGELLGAFDIAQMGKLEDVVLFAISCSRHWADQGRSNTEWPAYVSQLLWETYPSPIKRVDPADWRRAVEIAKKGGVQLDF